MIASSGRSRESERRAVQLMRAALFAWYGDVCACCGTTENLCVDHIDGDGKAQRIELFGRNPVSGPFYRWLIENEFPDGIQTLCTPCNTSKGTGSSCGLYHGPPLEADEKWCSSCRRIRKRADFHRNKNLPDGLTSKCKDCNTRHQASWRERHQTGRTVSIKPDTVGGRIMAYLAEHGPSASKTIANALELTTSSAGANLSGLAREGHIQRLSRGVYCLPGQALKELERVYENRVHGGRNWAEGTTWTTQEKQ